MPGDVNKPFVGFEREPQEKKEFYLGKGSEIDGLEKRIKLAKDAEEYFDYYTRLLHEPFRKIANHWQGYLCYFKDTALRYDQRWRSRIRVPLQYQAVEVKTSHQHDLFWSQNPPIQAEAVTASQEEVDRLNQWFDFVFRRGHFKRETALAFRERAIQGYTVRKSVHIRKERDIFVHPSEELLAQFDEAVKKMIQLSGQPPPTPEQFPDMELFKQAYEDYRQVAISSGVDLPEMPIPGHRRVINYWGPGWKRIPVFNFLWDPYESHKDQEVVIQQSIVPNDWVIERTGDDVNKPFDKEAVSHGLKGGSDTRRVTDFVNQLASVVGVVGASDSSPRYDKSSEILEFYKVGDKNPFRIILNRKVAINKLKEIPLDSGDHPFTIIPNIDLPFTGIGLSDLYLNASLFREFNTLRSLRVDAVKMAVLPVFAKTKEVGMTEMMRRISPGIIVESVMGTQSFGQASKVTVPFETFREADDIRNDVMDTIGTPPIVQGQLGPSRVTAMHAERAREGVIKRFKMDVMSIEDDLSKTVDDFLMIGYQYYNPKVFKQIMPVLSKFKREDFLNAINMEFAFRAATTALNKELNTQQKKDLFITFVNAQVPRLKPEVFAKRLLNDVDQNMDDVWMTDEEWAAHQEELRKQAEAEAAQAAAGGAPPPQPGAQPPQPGV